MSELENKLPSYLTYHNTIHTKYVLKKAIHIAGKENISEHELLLLKVAALYHDTGFTISRENHESLGCGLARNDLKEYDFSDDELDKISGMIMATRIPQQPNTQLEKILADADLEYLGTSKFDYFSEKLFQELKHFQPLLDVKQWNDSQIKFISNHSYHTDFCRKYREPVKSRNLEKIKKQAALLF